MEDDHDEAMIDIPHSTAVRYFYWATHFSLG